MQSKAATVKELDMGKCCVRFKKVENLALDVVAELLERVPAAKHIETYEAAVRRARTRPTKPRERGK